MKLKQKGWKSENRTLFVEWHFIYLFISIQFKRVYHYVAILEGQKHRPSTQQPVSLFNATEITGQFNQPVIVVAAVGSRR